jgi:uncharacterized protein
MAIGFAAQIVDGAIGMAYGLISTTILLSLGIPPATASASVHAAEVFTTGASGLSHWRFGNLDKRLFWKLAPAGMIGGGLGAYVLTAVPGDAIRPIVGIYLGIMGAVVLWKAFQRQQERPESHVCGSLAWSAGSWMQSEAAVGVLLSRLAWSVRARRPA